MEVSNSKAYLKEVLNQGGNKGIENLYQEDASRYKGNSDHNKVDVVYI